MAADKEEARVDLRIRKLFPVNAGRCNWLAILWFLYLYVFADDSVGGVRFIIGRTKEDAVRDSLYACPQHRLRAATHAAHQGFHTLSPKESPKSERRTLLA